MRGLPWLFVAALIVWRLFHLPPDVAARFRRALDYWPLWVSGAGWVLFSIYWDIAAKNAAPATNSESSASRTLHIVLANTAVVLLYAPAPGLRQRYLPAGPLIVAAGLAIEFASAFFAVWARRHLGRNWSGAVSIKKDHLLIRTGPYRFVRHPIYTGILGMYAGTAAVSGELHALLGLALAIAAYWRKIRIEEAVLVTAFGAEYEIWKRETPALLPGLF